MFKESITDVFFDLDHTLWDFDKNSARTFELIFGRHGIPINLDDFLKYYKPINLKYWKLYREGRVEKAELRYQRLKQSFDLLDLVLDDGMINSLADDYIHYLPSFDHLIPGTIDLLEYLKTRYRLHIITNGFSEVQGRKLVSTNIREYFTVVVNSELAGVKKPNPKIFTMALEMAKVPAESALMVGDDVEADVLGAMNVGMSAIHYQPYGALEQNKLIVVRHLDEIKRLL